MIEYVYKTLGTSIIYTAMSASTLVIPHWEIEHIQADNTTNVSVYVFLCACVWMN